MKISHALLGLGLAAGCTPGEGELRYDQRQGLMGVTLDEDVKCEGGPLNVERLHAGTFDPSLFSAERSLEVHVEGWKDYTLERVQLVVDGKLDGMQTRLEFNQSGLRTGHYHMSAEYFTAFRNEVLRVAEVDNVNVQCL